MGFEPTALRDLVGCSNHWATGDSVVSKGQIVGIDWNRIARLQSHVLAHMFSLTASRCHSEFICDALIRQRDAVSEIIWASTWLCSRAMRFQVPVNT